MKTAVPRYVTPRTPSRPTIGPDVVAIGRELGYTPMPWQVDMLETAMELDSDGSLFYSEVRVSVPRQSAKTTSTLWVFLDRMLNGEDRGWGSRQQCRYTAQYASDARTKMVDDWFPVVQDSIYSCDVAQYLLSNGREAIRFQDGGKLATFPPTGKGAHGSTLDCVSVDEAFAHVDGRVETGSRPAMITRPSPQLWVSSTAGTVESLYWREKVDDGRARVTAKDSEHVYYVEYSAGPDDDIHNPEHWYRWMPALQCNGGIIPEKAIAREHGTVSESEFRRAYGNEWTEQSSPLFPVEQWADCYAAKEERTGRVYMAVDCSPGVEDRGKSACISVASWHGDEVHVEVVAHGPGVTWVPDKVRELTRTHTVDRLYVDRAGPVGSITPDIERKAACNVEVTDAQTMVNACARFHQAVMDTNVRHRNQPELQDAVSGAVRRNLLDGWALTRMNSTKDISPLVSCVLAHWGAVTHPVQQLPPIISVGDKR